MIEGDLESPAEGDLRPYVVFTQLKPRGPHIYAGWLDAADDAMALRFAREHYGQDQKCVNVWIIPRSAIAGTEHEFRPSTDIGPRRPFEVFAQTKAGDQHVRTGDVEAESAAAALDAAIEMLDSPLSVWVVPRDEVSATGKDDVVWRYTSQDYRMARGYAASVRKKWEQVRAEKDISEYEKDDLREMF